MDGRFDFGGKVAVILGASSGIGQAVATMLAEASAATACVSRRGAAALVSQLTAAGHEALSLSADVSSEDDVARMVDVVRGRFGRIDILVNCAAIVQTGRLEDITLDEWRRVMDVNLTGAFLTSRAVVPVMRRHGGSIVLVSSIAGRFRSGFSGLHYVTSKAALIGFARQLAFDLAPHGIRVNAVCPGQTETPMLCGTIDAAGRDRLLRQIPLGRVATPEEQAGVIAFLVSDLAAYMTGAIVDVNGGQL